MSIVNYVTGKTKLLGVIGNPLSHSISPQLHNTLSNYLGINAAYVPLHVEKENLKDAVNGLKALNFKGFNITIPYKSEIIQYVDNISKEASLIGAVNTVKINGNILHGYNTDVDGFINSFKEETKTCFSNKKVVIIGAGGAARAIAVGVAYDGAKKISILNRTIAKANKIADIINHNILYYKKYKNEECPKSVECFDLDDKVINEVLQQGDIIINTTSLGMYPNISEMPVPNSYEFSANQIVYDVIYNPAKTKFMAEAEKKGCKVINGLGMLIYQGIKAYEIWMDVEVPQNVADGIFNQFNLFGKNSPTSKYSVGEDSSHKKCEDFNGYG